MILIDANILLYAYNEASAQHKKCRSWVEAVFSGTELIGLPWQTIAAFLRITTNPGIPAGRRSLEQAFAIVESWIDQPNVSVLSPGEDHWILLRRIIIDGQASGALISDAQLAALTIEFGGVLYTTDRDFSRFPGLRWKNPLE